MIAFEPFDVLNSAVDHEKARWHDVIEQVLDCGLSANDVALAVEQFDPDRRDLGIQQLVDVIDKLYVLKNHLEE